MVWAGRRLRQLLAVADANDLGKSSSCQIGFDCQFEAKEGQEMRESGKLLMILGAGLALFAFSMDTAVSSAGTFIAGQYVGGGETYNLGLLQQQMMVLHSGLAAFVAGAFLYGAVGPVEAGSENKAPLTKRWADIQENETQEERDKRVNRATRRDILILFGIAVTIIAIALLVPYLDSQSEADGNNIVDMNSMDMNAMDMNATDPNMTLNGTE